VDAQLDAVNMNDKTPVTARFGRWVDGLLHLDRPHHREHARQRRARPAHVGQLAAALIGSIAGSLGSPAAPTAPSSSTGPPIIR
jgi:hypothetical protein